jgi:hypothetical protein
MTRQQRPRVGSILVLIPLLLAACARDRAALEASARFGAAAASLAASAESEFLHIRRDVIELRAERYALDAESARPATASAASGLPAGPAGPEPSVDAGVEITQAEARIGGARSLAAFGTLLSVAASETDLRDPAARAIDSLRLHRLLGADGLSDPQANALADLADAVAHHAFDARRAGAVRRAVLETEDAVRELTEAIRADFDPAAQRWLTNLTTEDAESQLLRDRMAAESLHGSAVDDSRIARARALAQRAARADADALQAAAQIRAAADAMLRAHKGLLAQLRADQPITLDEIDAFLNRAERLKVTVQILRAD